MTERVRVGYPGATESLRIKWDPKKHPRRPKGIAGAGEFGPSWGGVVARKPPEPKPVEPKSSDLDDAVVAVDDFLHGKGEPPSDHQVELIVKGHRLNDEMADALHDAVRRRRQEHEKNVRIAAAEKKYGKKLTPDQKAKLAEMLKVGNAAAAPGLQEEKRLAAQAAKGSVAHKVSKNPYQQTLEHLEKIGQLGPTLKKDLDRLRRSTTIPVGRDASREERDLARRLMGIRGVWNKLLHPRIPSGHGGGEFATVPDIPAYGGNNDDGGGGSGGGGTSHTLPDIPAYGGGGNDPPNTEGLASRLDAAYRLTPDQRAAVQDYTGHSSKTLNPALRDGTYRQHPGDTMSGLLSAMHPMPETALVERSVPERSVLPSGGTPGPILRVKPGDIVADDGFSSTSLRGTHDFGDLRMRITLPAGTPALWIGERTAMAGEQELLLPPGTKLVMTEPWTETGSQGQLTASFTAVIPEENNGTTRTDGGRRLQGRREVDSRATREGTDAARTGTGHDPIGLSRGYPWDEAKHPRLPHGHGGGEFAHLFSGGGAEHHPPGDLGLPHHPHTPPLQGERDRHGNWISTKDWQRVGHQKGSNSGGFYDAPNGQHFYIKTPKTATHVGNEVLAAQLYRESGVTVPDVQPILHDGKPSVASPISKGTENLSERMHDPAYRAKIFDGFAVDAWLANWDVAGLDFDNLLEGKHGEPLRIDVGGSLLFRAMGEPKGSKFGDQVGETSTFKAAGHAGQVFHSITDEQIRDSFIRHVRPMTPDRIRSMVDGNTPHWTPEQRKALSDRLIARRADLAKQTGVPLPENTPTPDFAKIPDVPVNEPKLPDPKPEWITPPPWPATKHHPEPYQPQPYQIAPPHVSSGMVVMENGGVWLTEPKGHFGGYSWTFPKGTMEPGSKLTAQQNAHKELFEESGLQAKVTGYLGDYKGSTSITRMYSADRAGGTPLLPDATAFVPGSGTETASVVLVSPDRAMKMLGHRDQKVLSAATGIPMPPPPPMPPMPSGSAQPSHTGQLADDVAAWWKAHGFGSPEDSIEDPGSDLFRSALTPVGFPGASRFERKVATHHPYDPKLHPHAPKGTPGHKGGQFVSKDFLAGASAPKATASPKATKSPKVKLGSPQPAFPGLDTKPGEAISQATSNNVYKRLISQHPDEIGPKALNGIGPAKAHLLKLHALGQWTTPSNGGPPASQSQTGDWVLAAHKGAHIDVGKSPEVMAALKNGEYGQAAEAAMHQYATEKPWQQHPGTPAENVSAVADAVEAVTSKPAISVPPAPDVHVPPKIDKALSKLDIPLVDAKAMYATDPEMTVGKVQGLPDTVTHLHHKNLDVWYSYKTPVAYQTPGGDLITAQKGPSPTSTKHLHWIQDMIGTKGPLNGYESQPDGKFGKGLDAAKRQAFTPKSTPVDHSTESGVLPPSSQFGSPASTATPIPATVASSTPPSVEALGWTHVAYKSKTATTPATVMADDNGDHWYVKLPGHADGQAADREVVAARLYSALGIPVPDVQRVTKNGYPAVASKMVVQKPHLKKAPRPGSLAAHPEIRKQIPVDGSAYPAVGLLAKEKAKAEGHPDFVTGENQDIAYSEIIHAQQSKQHAQQHRQHVKALAAAPDPTTAQVMEWADNHSGGGAPNASVYQAALKELTGGKPSIADGYTLQKAIENGNPVTAHEIIAGLHAQAGPKTKKKIPGGPAADAWLGTHPEIITGSDGIDYRVGFGPVSTAKTLTPAELLSGNQVELKQSFATVAKLKPSDIAKIVAQNTPSMTAAERGDLIDTLLSRRKDMAAKLGVALPNYALLPSDNPQAQAMGVPAGSAKLVGKKYPMSELQPGDTYIAGMDHDTVQVLAVTPDGTLTAISANNLSKPSAAPFQYLASSGDSVEYAGPADVVPAQTKTTAELKPGDHFSYPNGSNTIEGTVTQVQGNHVSFTWDPGQHFDGVDGFTPTDPVPITPAPVPQIHAGQGLPSEIMPTPNVSHIPQATTPVPVSGHTIPGDNVHLPTWGLPSTIDQPTPDSPEKTQFYAALGNIDLTTRPDLEAAIASGNYTEALSLLHTTAPSEAPSKPSPNLADHPEILNHLGYPDLATSELADVKAKAAGYGTPMDWEQVASYEVQQYLAAQAKGGSGNLADYPEILAKINDGHPDDAAILLAQAKAKAAGYGAPSEWTPLAQYEIKQYTDSRGSGIKPPVPTGSGKLADHPEILAQIPTGKGSGGDLSGKGKAIHQLAEAKAAAAGHTPPTADDYNAAALEVAQHKYGPTAKADYATASAQKSMEANGNSPSGTVSGPPSTPQPPTPPSEPQPPSDSGVPVDLGKLPNTPVGRWVREYLSRGGPTVLKEPESAGYTLKNKLDGQFPMTGPGIASGAIAAMKNYTSSGYAQMSEKMRGHSGYGGPTMPESARDWLTMFRPLPQTMPLNRTMNSSGRMAPTMGAAKPGDIYADPGFTSTRVRYGSGGITMHIVAPAGVPVFWAGDRSSFDGEDEMVLAPDQPLVLLGTTGTGYGLEQWYLAVPPGIDMTGTTIMRSEEIALAEDTTDAQGRIQDRMDDADFRLVGQLDPAVLDVLLANSPRPWEDNSSRHYVLIPVERLRRPHTSMPWDPAKHPHAPKGSPGHTGGEFVHTPGTVTSTVGGTTHTHGDTVSTDDVTVAVQALGEGKHVELHSYRQVSTLLDRLAAIVDDAKAKGTKAPTYDLCKVSVPGTNLFCAESKGIPRVLMPQLSGVPVKGSPADKLPKNAKGEVDIGPGFVDLLHRRGVAITDDTADPAVLKASQRQLNGAKVAGMAQALAAGKLPSAPIFTTKDDYIVDGHHRWAANVANEIRQGGDVPPMPVRVIDADILHVLALANIYALTQGIRGAGVDAATPKALNEEPQAHPGEHAGDPGAGIGVTDTQYEMDKHIEKLESMVGTAMSNGQATKDRYGIDVDKGVWTAERAVIHKQIVDEMYAKAATVPNDGKAVISGGLGGSGKSTVLNGPAHIDRSKYLTINADDVKEIMAEKGLIPTVDHLKPMEASTLVHTEAAHIADLLALRAMNDRKNIIFDTTMSAPQWIQPTIDQLRAHGYHNVEGVFVDIPVETSVQRAMTRYIEGQKTPLGGRYVPPTVIRRNRSGTTSTNRQTFDQIRSQFDRSAVYDNSGTAPVLVGAA